VQIHIKPNDGAPIYEQVVNQVKRLVASGRLSAGEELPAIRVLAEQLLVNPNTIARAYRELEVAGIVVKRRTAGTFISKEGIKLSRKDRLELLSEKVDSLLIEADQLDISPEDLCDLINKRKRKK
jgi:DNA-binding transcriptional regulator YhcF (GntR family)